MLYCTSSLSSKIASPLTALAWSIAINLIIAHFPYNVKNRETTTFGGCRIYGHLPIVTLISILLSVFIFGLD
jgi:hypothetical protein